MAKKKKKQKIATPYDGIDELNVLLFKKINTYFNRTRLKLQTKKYKGMTYDDILEETDLLFYLLLDMVFDNYYKSAKEVYKGIKKDDVHKFLEEYYIVTKYSFFSEWQRKATRHAEALYTMVSNNKSLNSADALMAQKTSVNLLKKQIDEYGVYVIDRAILEKANAEKATKLQWITEDDEKVCAICKKRKNRIYDIKKYPAKPHYGCRCYPKIVGKEE